MALMACPECKSRVSTTAFNCPHCGFPLDSREFDIEPAHPTAVQNVRQEKEAARPPAKGWVRVSLQRVLGPDSQMLQLPYLNDTRVAAFLEEIWRAMSSRVEPFTYGKVWVLREVHASRVFDVGSSWAKSHGVASDTRTLAEAGIMPGLELEVVPLVSV